MLIFLGIGAQKSGTSWLYHCLSHHPDVRFPGGKELHFWDQPQGRDLEWYRGIFAGYGIEGEITPAYGILPVETIRNVRGAFPSVRLIFLMRNPIDRAWSSAKMALGRAEMTFSEASDQWFIDHFRSSGSLLRGDYETCIRNWRDVFPPRQMLILKYDEIISNPRRVIYEVCCHIGVDSAFSNNISEEILRSRIFPSEKIALPYRLRENLDSAYRNKIERLQEYLSIDLSGWLEGAR